MITFSEFASKNTFSPTDQIVGYSDTALGGEKRWSYSTLANAVTSVVASTITNTTVLQQALTAGNLAIGEGSSDVTTINGRVDQNLDIRNTAFGLSALKANTTGVENAAFGYLSLANNTTGRQNVAIGPYSLYSNLTASYNTAVGYGALSSFVAVPSELGDNTAIGNASLQAMTLGINNTVVGDQAACYLKYGKDNVFVGENIAVGSSTTGTLLSATGCVFIGQGTGTRTYAPTAHPTNCIYIGHNVESPTDENNVVRIGNSSITQNHFNGDLYIDGTRVYTYVPLFPVSGTTTNTPTCTWPAKAYPVSGTAPAGNNLNGRWSDEAVQAAQIGNIAFTGPDVTYDLTSSDFPVPITAKFVNLMLSHRGNTFRNGSSSVNVKIGNTYYQVHNAETINTTLLEANGEVPIIVPITGAGTNNRTVILQYYNSSTGGTPSSNPSYQMSVTVLGYYL